MTANQLPVAGAGLSFTIANTQVLGHSDQAERSDGRHAGVATAGYRVKARIPKGVLFGAGDGCQGCAEREGDGQLQRAIAGVVYSG